MLTEQEQIELSKSKNTWVRVKLAQNPSLVERLQDVLAQDKDEIVRVVLATNSALKLKPAMLLYFDENERVVESLKSNNMKLYRRIESLEKKALQDTNMPFVGVGNAAQRRAIGKKILAQNTLGL